MATLHSDTLQRIDQLIREGNVKTAAQLLKKLRRDKIRRTDLVNAASLARRANLAPLAIRLLNPIVRPSRKAPAQATEKEKAEYAVALIKIGAVEEALGILKTLNGSQNPEVHLYTAFGFVAEWDYENSIPSLQDYLKASGLTDYQKLIARVNLAAALVHERRSEEASHLLDELLIETESSGRHLLHGNLLELSAQNSILSDQWERAREYLRRSEAILKNTGTVYAFFVRKWKAILEVKKTGGHREALSKLQDIREEAAQLSHWETMRDCDLFEAIARDDRDLFLRLYFGTPFEAYRKKIVVEMSEPEKMPTEYCYLLGQGERGRFVFDLETGENTRNRMRLKVGQVLHRLLATLCSDFYRPFSLTRLHSSVYAGEYFNPVTSPHRIHHALKCLRAWFKRSHLPFVIEEKAAHYRLVSREACTIRIPLSGLARDKGTFDLSRLRNAFPGETFSAHEAARALGISWRSTIRVLNKGLSDESLARVGAGSITRYRFAS